MHSGKITEHDPDGKPVRITGTFMDITDRKDAEKELLESEARFKRVADSLDEWVWEVDTERNVPVLQFGSGKNPWIFI